MNIIKKSNIMNFIQNALERNKLRKFSKNLQSVDFMFRRWEFLEEDSEDESDIVYKSIDIEGVELFDEFTLDYSVQGFFKIVNTGCGVVEEMQRSIELKESRVYIRFYKDGEDYYVPKSVANNIETYLGDIYICIKNRYRIE